MLRPPRVADPRPTCTVVEAVSILHSTPYSNSVRLSPRAELNAVKRTCLFNIAAGRSLNRIVFAGPPLDEDDRGGGRPITATADNYRPRAVGGRRHVAA